MFDFQWEEELISNVKRNINWALEKNYNNNQTLMAKDLNIKTNTLYTYINTDTKPALTFICKLCARANIELEAFIYEDLDNIDKKIKNKEVIKQIYNRFKGTYYTYFFVVDSNSLKEGLIQEAVLQISEKGVANFEILHSNKVFSGGLIVSDEIVYFDLKSAKEKINITVKNPGKNIREKYLGGIGITNISSPEDNRIPSAQKIVISAERIPIDKYFIALNEFLSIDMSFKIRKKFLLEIFSEKLNISSEKYEKLKVLLQNNRISDEGKVKIGEKQMNFIQWVLDKEEFTIFKSTIEECHDPKDIVRPNGIKVNLEEDKMLYRFIKNEFSFCNHCE